jgi:hypothetical protein
MEIYCSKLGGAAYLTAIPVLLGAEVQRWITKLYAAVFSDPYWDCKKLIGFCIGL